jgi:predicted PurR-regulated permease PerM
MSAQVKDAAVVGLLWLIGLLIIGIPLAPLWAILGALFQFIPILGTILALVGPAFSAMFVEGWMPLVYVLILYALIVLADGFILQPMFMKRNARVPVWASILVPIVLGTIFNVWGILLAPPILAIIYSHRTGKTQHDSDESYQMKLSFKQEREEK